MNYTVKKDEFLKRNEHVTLKNGIPVKRFSKEDNHLRKVKNGRTLHIKSSL